MKPRHWTIVAAVAIAGVAAAAAHYIALSCCFTPLSIVGLVGYSLIDGYWLDWLSVGVLALTAAVASASFGAARMNALSREAFKRSTGVLMWTGLGIALLVPSGLWAFVFVPGIYRYNGGVWAYYAVQSPLIDTFIYLAMGSMVFALASYGRLQAERRDRSLQ